MAGAPHGNKNSAKGREWESAIRRALGRHDSGRGVAHTLDKIADKIVAAAVEGDRWALEHIADRLDGKPKQTVEGKFEHEHTVTTGDATSLNDRLTRALSTRTQNTVQ